MEMIKSFLVNIIELLTGFNGLFHHYNNEKRVLSFSRQLFLFKLYDNYSGLQILKYQNIHTTHFISLYMTQPMRRFHLYSSRITDYDQYVLYNIIQTIRYFN